MSWLRQCFGEGRGGRARWGQCPLPSAGRETLESLAGGRLRSAVVAGGAAVETQCLTLAAGGLTGVHRSPSLACSESR